MKPSIFFHSWNPFESCELDFDKSVSISVDTFQMDESAEKKILLLYVGEPTTTLPHINPEQEILNKFDKIYTHNSELLKNYNQAEFIPFGSCWLDFENLNLNKQNHISFVTSSKCYTEGHLLRQKIYDYFDRINFVNEFEIYQHKSPPFYLRRNSFFETSKFHVSVENCREPNYFSEKLIDCFASKTVPIYYGCPNVEDFFNVHGMLIFKSYEEFLEKINQISLNVYDEMKDAIEDNYERCKQYYGENCITKRLPNKIIQYVQTQN